VVLNFPANIPNVTGHHWASAVAMATPIAHKGTTAGAQVMAMTMVDLLTKPALVQQAWGYFNDVQTRTVKYRPLISPEDKPATWLNTKIMAAHRESMRKFYYDPAKFETYLDQLGIKYPTVRAPAKPAAANE
jgi:aminobenzoyl-glutamate utilization protein B